MSDTNLPKPNATVATSCMALLLILAGWHFLLDTVACIVQPLWPSLEGRLSLQSGQILWLFLVWSMTNSFGQLVVALFADRFPSRWLIWAGPTLAVICMSCIGLITSAWAMGVLFFVGGLSIAAFHPEAAATAGACLPEHRSRAMSIFALAGYVGQSAGPFYSGIVTKNWGLAALLSVMVWGLLTAAVLFFGTQTARRPVMTTTHESLSLSILSSRSSVIALLISIGTLRVLVAMGIPLAMAFLLDARKEANDTIGFVQSSFMFGIGAGGFACATLIRQHRERTVLWLFPFCAVPLVAFLARMDGWFLIGFTVLSGVGIGITLPVLISYGQRLLPEGQRTASSLTMGVTWGLGAAILAGVMAILKQQNMVEAAFPLFALSLLTSGLLCGFLPHQPVESSA